jgi:hypothetical protein
LGKKKAIKEERKSSLFYLKKKFDEEEVSTIEEKEIAYSFSCSVFLNFFIFFSLL